jgi:hypothetical protein
LRGDLGRGAGQQRQDESNGGGPWPSDPPRAEERRPVRARLDQLEDKPAAFKALRVDHQKSLLPLRVS